VDPLLLAAGAFGLGAYGYRRPTALFNRLVYARLYAQGYRPQRCTLPRVQVRCWVGGRGEPLVFVHGFGTEAAVNWHAQLPVVRRHYRVIAPDLPGFGASGHLADDHSIARQVACLRDLLDQLGHECVRLVGHSMGGWISLAFAAEFPERVSHLLLVDAAGLRFEPDLSMRPALLPECIDDVRTLIAANFQAPPRLPRFVLRDVLRVCRSETHREQILEGLVYGEQFVDDRIAHITAPTLVVWGRTDTLVPLAIGEQLARRIADAELVVFDDCAHSPNVERPRRFNALMLEFLSRPRRTVTPPSSVAAIG
jgi:pimeloyl-ACP methyl ester carboxylesterase